jgi:hypothetical protein
MKNPDYRMLMMVAVATAVRFIETGAGGNEEEIAAAIERLVSEPAL